MLPIDLLPIKRPLEDSTKLPSDYFYNNVIKPIIPDIIKLELVGIPINLDKVVKVEETVDNVLDNVRKELTTNSIMLRFLKDMDTKAKKELVQETSDKQKKPEDFLKEFNPKNKIHRSIVINTYLTDNNHEDMLLEEWTVKDLKKLNHILGSRFIQDVINNEYKKYMKPIIDKGMYNLATQKADIYNKNLMTKINDTITTVDLINEFNPASSNQKRDFFAYYGIESEAETKAGNQKWDKVELEKLKELLDNMIEDKQGDHSE
jgi:hypothetical protein